MKRYFVFFVLIFLFIEIFSLFPPYDVFNDKNSTYLKGVIHVHSNFSPDASGTIAEIMESANNADLDFIVLTDHDTSESRRLGLEKRYGNVDLFIEMEASTIAGHLIPFCSHTSLKNLPDKDIIKLSWDYMSGINDIDDFFAVIPHPSHVRNPWKRLDLYGDGLEVINFNSLFARSFRFEFWSLIANFLILPFNKFLSTAMFVKPYEKDFISWDTANMLSNKKIIGTIGHDTHQKIPLYDNYFIKWPTYLTAFKVANLIVYTDGDLPSDFEKRKKAIYNFIRSGNIAIVFRYLYPPKDLSLKVKCGLKLFGIGENVPFNEGNCRFLLKLPQNFPYETNIKVIRNAEVVKTFFAKDKTVEIPIKDKGIYRIEIFVKLKTFFGILLNRLVPYAFFNPMFVI